MKPKQIKAKFKPSDFEGNNYNDNGDCALSRLVKRIHKGATNLSAGPYDIDFITKSGVDRRYEISKRDGDRIAHTFQEKTRKRDFEITLIPAF